MDIANDTIGICWCGSKKSYYECHMKKDITKDKILYEPKIDSLPDLVDQWRKERSIPNAVILNRLKKLLK